MRGLRSGSVKRAAKGRTNLALFALALTQWSCAVDDRELNLVTAPLGGSASGAAGTNAGGAGGTAGSTPAGLDAPPPPPCSYQPGEEVEEGCETLVVNPGFDELRKALGWLAATQLIQTGWEKRDATGIAKSGAMSVANNLYAPEKGETINGAVQCVPAIAGAVYDVAADVLIPGHEGEGRAGISVLFYRPTDCNASNVGTDMSFTTDLVDKVDAWQPVAGRFVVPAGMQSMEITLVAAKPFQQLSFTAIFDNVLVQEK